MIQTGGKKCICWIEKHSCSTIFILLIHMKRFRIETLKCVCRTRVVAETRHIKNQEQFAQGPPGASGRTGTRPRATHGTTQVLMERWLAAVSIAAVKRSQANITFVTDFFFSLPVYFYQNTFIKIWVMWMFLHPTCFSASKRSASTTLSSCVAGRKVLHRALYVHCAGRDMLLPRLSSSFSSPLLLVHPCVPAPSSCPGNCSSVNGHAKHQTWLFSSHTIPYTLFLASLLAETTQLCVWGHSWPCG